jgi:hypothetical protein
MSAPKVPCPTTKVPWSSAKVPCPEGLHETPCSAFVLRLFPKPCIPRKRHSCRICGQWIAPKEPCCRWSGFDDGPWTSHAHPECYDSMEGEDHGTWESMMPGDGERPTVRMYWPNSQRSDA